MNTQSLYIRGTQINKIAFSEIADLLEDKGINVNEAFELLSDINEMIYVSNGFISGLTTQENEQGEWHHYFKKSEDGSFEAGKMKFN